MHGQAKGVRDNYRVNKDIYDRNAEYGEESKQQSTNSKIDTLGGVGKAVALDVKSASIQAAESSGSINDRLKWANDKNYQENRLKGLEDGGASVESLKNSDGSAKTGLDLIKAEAASRARKFAMKDSLIDDNGKELAFSTDKEGNIGKLSVDGSTKLDNSSSINNQHSEKAGKSFDAGWLGENIYKNLDGARAAEAAAFGMNPKEWVKGIAAMGHDKGVEALQGLGYNKDEAENLYNTIASPAVGIAGTVAIAEIASRVSGKGSFVGKMWDALPNPLDKTSKNSESPTSHSDDNSPNSKVNNESNHNKSFNSDVDSMPNNSESVNSKKGGWGNFIGERFNAASKAMDGSGSWKTKLALGASAMILGSVSETSAKALELADPISHIMGTSTSTDADLKLGQNSAQTLTGVTPIAPAHLQNFTTQPSGYNTYQAMQEQHQAVTASNVGTLATIVESRSGGLTLQDANTSPVSFTTSKAEGHNVMMNRRPKICTTKKKPPLTINCGSNLSLNARLRALNFSHLK